MEQAVEVDYAIGEVYKLYCTLPGLLGSYLWSGPVHREREGEAVSFHYKYMCQLLSVVVRRLGRRGRLWPPETGPLAASNLQNDVASSVCAEKVYVNQQKSFGET